MSINRANYTGKNSDPTFFANEEEQDKQKIKSEELLKEEAIKRRDASRKLYNDKMEERIKRK